jgi:[protein-PII] uridylyltransferase
MSTRARTLAPGIVLNHGEIEVDPSVDVEEVDALLPLRVAVLAATHGAVVERRSLQSLAKLPALPEPWPPEARRLLIELLQTGRPAIRVIEGLDMRGCWTTILPEWADVRSRPQHNAYHRFTVDRHLLETVAEAAPLAERTERPDLLVVAALLHDLGKGRSRDHTALGVELAERIATRMGFPAEDVQTLVDMVRYHLLLPEVATRRDLGDPATIAMVASAVGTAARLHLLAALSEADSRATGHGAWGPWKRDLLQQLVDEVERLIDGHHPVESSTDRHFTPEQQALLEQRGQVVEAKDDVVTVVADDRPGLFSRVAGVLALHGLDVLGASAYTGDNGRAVSEFKVVDRVRETTPWRRIVSDLERALDGRLAVNARIAARVKTYERRHPAYTQLAVSAVKFDNSVSPAATVIDVYAPDGIGLLYRITRAMAELDLDIRSAKAETFGVQAVDSFYVLDRRGAKITDDAALAEMEREILHSAIGDAQSVST